MKNHYSKTRPETEKKLEKSQTRCGICEPVYAGPYTKSRWTHCKRRPPEFWCQSSPMLLTVNTQNAGQQSGSEPHVARRAGCVRMQPRSLEGKSS